jgi:ABC-type multidrug transport system ATPase subunit
MDPTEDPIPQQEVTP